MPDYVEALKMELGELIARRIAGWRRADIAAQARLTLADVSRLRRLELRRFSLESLIRCASALGYDVELRITRRSALERSGRDA